MTDPAPIPPAEFTAALDSLDPDDLVAFVGELWAATGNDVDVDPPIVTVRSDGSRTDLVVAPAASDAAIDASRPADEGGPGASPETVVLPDEGSVPPDAGPETVSSDDLRERLLYALPMADAESVCERFLGVPARSGSYDRRPVGRGSTGETDGTAGAAGNRVAEGRTADDRLTADRGTGSVSTAQESTVSSSDPRPDIAASRPRQRDGDARRGRLAVAVVVVLLFATIAGAASLTDQSLSDGVGDRLDPDGEPMPASGGDTVDGSEGVGESSDSSSTDSTGSVDVGDSGTDTGVTDSGGPFADSGETDRNGSAAERATALEPTCERGPLHVVQIQMNALRYNDPATNDGIRTTRRFASPRNRQAVSTFEGFVEIFDGTSYAPMLSHDSVRYTPLGIDGDRATVRVVTYEDSSATGRYEFRLRKMNASDGSSTGYDGCWMTDSVAVTATGDAIETTETNGTETNGTEADSSVHGPPGN
ncbi:hypothetical protein DQW50_06710 [Halorubrum sp. 48-1-W]|uniref:hypothetical protein n=1 Tax=Halorubrum sp. 48-1-W TaxID=2249761 RepID=UPI000DCDFDAA|nr:hypothetical protein [Halorubrum sp. 48-1-W]RAW45896.1 hypothetical protein DQW50_06710 [Halorubrum sp. 48-1-W]